MALSIIDKPYQITPVNQKLIVVLYDAVNNSNVGHKYYLKIVRSSDSSVVSEHYFEKNVNGYGVFDLSPVLKDEVVTPIVNNGTLVFEAVLEDGLNAGCFQDLQGYTIYVNEGDTTTGEFVLLDEEINWNAWYWDGYFYPYQDYKLNPDSIYRINHLDNLSPKQVLTSMPPNRSARYLIPTMEAYDRVFKCGNGDFGALNYIGWNDTDTDTFNSSNHSPNQIQYKIYNKSNTLLDTATITLPQRVDPSINIIGAYPANISNSLSGVDLPNASTDWAYYSLQFFDANIADPSRPYPVKPKYWFYREECEARFTKVRLGWLNHHGGRDQFNFTKKNEISHEVERKQYKRILGDYSTAGGTFTMDANVGQIVETPIQSKMYITITSDWIDKFDFKYLTSLIRSKQVHIIDTDGNITPVVVEENSWLERNDKSAKQYNVTLKLRFANGFQAWQI